MKVIAEARKLEDHCTTQATDDGSLDLRGSRGLEKHESSWSLFGGSWQLVLVGQIHGSAGYVAIVDSGHWSKATAGPPSHGAIAVNGG